MLRSIMKNGTALCSMGMFDNWAGGGGTKTPASDPANGKTPGDNTDAAKKPAPAKANGSGAATDPNSKNDDGTDGDLVAKIWEAQKPSDDKTKKDDTNNDNKTTVDANKQVTDYLAGIGLDPIVLSEQEVESFKDGTGIQSFLDRVNTKIQTAHTKAVSAAHALVTKAVDTAVAKAVETSDAKAAGTRYRDHIKANISAAKSPLFSPIVESVFKQFIDKGANIDQATNATKTYLEKLAQEIDPQVNTNNGGRFRTPQRAENTDWLAMLQG